MRRTFASQRVRDLAEPYTFRPFDVRWVYWHKNIVYNMRGEKMEVFRSQRPPIGFMFSRNTKHDYYSNVYVTRHIPDRHCLEEANVAPLYTRAHDGFVTEASSNLSARAADFVAQIGLCLERETHGDLTLSCGTQDIMSFVYAVLYGNDYRRRYADFLQIDFARVPAPESIDLFRKLVALGQELMTFHLLESRQVDRHITTYAGPRNPEVGRVGWSDDTVWLDAGNQCQRRSACDQTRYDRFSRRTGGCLGLPHRRPPSLPQMAQGPKGSHALRRGRRPLPEDGCCPERDGPHHERDRRVDRCLRRLAWSIQNDAGARPRGVRPC